MSDNRTVKVQHEFGEEKDSENYPILVLTLANIVNDSKVKGTWRASPTGLIKSAGGVCIVGEDGTLRLFDGKETDKEHIVLQLLGFRATGFWNGGGEALVATRWALKLQKGERRLVWWDKEQRDFINKNKKKKSP